MKIISGFRHKSTPEWNQWINNLKRSAERYAYEVYISDLPTQDEWVSTHPDLYLSLCWKYKVLFLLEAIERFKDDLVWIDGDCLVARHINFDEVMADCDIAFTLRDIKDRDNNPEAVRDGYINSGVIYLKNNPHVIDFLKATQYQLINSLYDQEAFNRVLLQHSKMEKHGEIISVRGFKIKMLDCREYNNFYLDNHSVEKARILHFKGEGRKEYNRWIDKLALKG